MFQCQADTATRPRLARHGPARCRHGPTRPDTVRRGLAWRGLTWLIEVRGLANRSEGLANRSEGLGAGLAWALSIKVRGWGPGWPGPVDKSEGLGAGLAQPCR